MAFGIARAAGLPYDRHTAGREYTIIQWPQEKLAHRRIDI
jgi:hypothetical protein